MKSSSGPQQFLHKHSLSIAALYGGTSVNGTIFRLTPNREFTVLYEFDSNSEGTPAHGLIQATDGAFYGTTQYDYIFKMDIGLPPFVMTAPRMGRVSSSIRILGSDLSGATSVTFNGQPANFTIPLPTEIIAQVPSGATTGRVTVTTPNAVLTSNINFVVR